MKTLSHLSLLLFVSTVLTLSAHADEPEVTQTGKLTPQMQARLLQLLGANELTSSKPAVTSLTASPGTARASKSSQTSPASTALRTGSLRTGHLATSGTLSGAPRLNEDDWRQLFPLRR